MDKEKIADVLSVGQRAVRGLAYMTINMACVKSLMNDIKRLIQQMPCEASIP